VGFGRFWVIVTVWSAMAIWGYAGYLYNDSYDTRCAEMDNINIPVHYSNATAYRVTVTHPKYYPTTIAEWGADFSECTFEGRGIWEIGYNDGLSSEFDSSYSFTNGDTYFALDNPTAGVDEVYSQMPREINNDWLYDQYIQFTADENEDVNLEVRIGAKFTVKMGNISGTLEIKAFTMTTNGWVDQGSRVFDTSNREQYWDIPDLTWLEGVDSNTIHLQVVREHLSSFTTTNSWAYYDWMELRKRDEAGDNSTSPNVLFSSTNVVIETIHIDFWWRYPEAMTVSVVGGNTDTNVHYLRIKRRMPDSGNWNEIFVMYEDGNARVLPFPPSGLGAVPYGASIILGPTTNSPRPFAEIDEVVIDPDDLSLDVTYGGVDNSAHIELRVSSEAHIVDVTDVTYDTQDTALTRFRSMWNYDGKSDIDRILTESGTYHITDGWTTLPGSWWQFFRETPSYHNTYCPDFRVDVMDADQAIYSGECEDATSVVGAVIVSGRTNASGDEVFSVTNTGGELVFTNIVLAQDSENVAMHLYYAQTSDANDIEDLANLVYVVVDGVFTSETTHVIETGGLGQYEMLPAIQLGGLSAGVHTLKIVVGAAYADVELDTFDWVAHPFRGWIRNTLLVRQAEAYDSASNVIYETRAGVPTIHLEHTGDLASAYYAVEISETTSNTYMRVRYTDDVGPNRIDIWLDGVLTAKFPTESTGAWDTFTNSYMLYLGALTGGWHEVEFVSDNATWGMDLDEFEIYSLEDNQSPVISIPPVDVVGIGGTSTFNVTVNDSDGDTPDTTNPIAPTGATYLSDIFSWVATVDYADSTSTVLFVADDLRGLTNSVVTNTMEIIVPFDWDLDELGDAWEWNAFATLQYSGTDDTDADGYDNESEYIAGTAPESADSVFALEGTQATGSPTDHHITIPTQPNRQYTIYYADGSLNTSTTWSTFTDTTDGIGTWLETNIIESTFTFVDDESASTTGSAPTEGLRYYKVKVQVP